MVKAAFISILSLVVFSGCSMQHGLVYAQCSGLDKALLKVSYPVPSWQDGNKVEVFVTESSPQVGSANIQEMIGEYPSNATFSFEVCLPRDDACGHIAVRGLPKDLYEVFWDGQLLHTDVEVWSSPERANSNPDTLFTTRQFGKACMLTCENSDEAVFELQYRRIPEFNMIPKYYRVEDQDGNEVIAHDGQSYSEGQMRAGLYAEKMCLPKNNCYRLVMGYERTLLDDEHLSVSFDNKAILEKGPFNFVSAEFGDGCAGASSSCDPDKESVVEFFMTSIFQDVPLSWELKSYDESRSSAPQIFHSEVQSSNLNITLHHDMVCIPKQSCLAFSLIPPQQSSDETHIVYYMLKVEDTIYRHSRFYTDAFSSAKPDTTYIGTCTNAICDSPDSSLLELNFQTISSDKWYTTSYYPDMSLGWQVKRLPPSLVEDDEDSALVSHFVEGNDFVRNYEFNSSYRMVQCIPNEECLNGLFIRKGGNNLRSYDQIGFESFSIKVDGVPASTDIGTSFEGFDVIPLDNDCDFGSSGESALSGGGTTRRIAIACTVLGGALIAFLVVLTIRRKKVGGHFHIPTDRMT